MTEVKYTYLLASDLDGTLIHGNDIVSEENERAIEELTRSGVCFAPCSGRSLMTMPECVRKNPNIRYYIGSDGSSVWDKKSETFLPLGLGMKRETVRPLLDLIDSYKTLPIVNYNGECYIDSTKYGESAFRNYRMSEQYIAFTKYYIHSKDGFEEFSRSVECIDMICVFFADDGEMAEFSKRVEEMGCFKITSSEPANLEITHISAGKGNGMLALAKMLGIPKENTVAVGDSDNDIDMLKKAGLGLAMENASDNVKATADRTICHYKEHSAKYILTAFFSRKESSKEKHSHWVEC